MHLRLRRAYIRPLFHQPRCQADRQVLRQPQAVEFERLVHPLAGEAAGKRGELITLLRQLLLQRWQRGARLRQCRLLGQHVGLRRSAKDKALTHHAKLIGLILDDVLGGGDLAAQRCLLNGGNHDVRGQREIRRLELEALIVGLRQQGFDLPSRAAEHVRCIGNIQ